MELAIKGEVIEIKDVQEFPNSNSAKQTVVVKEEDDKYPQEYPIDFWRNDKRDTIKLLEDIRVGNDVNVGANLKVNEYKGNRYINMTGWRISVSDRVDAENSTVNTAKSAENDSDNLPF